MEEEKKPRNIFEEASRSRFPRRMERKREAESGVQNHQEPVNEDVNVSSPAKIPDEEVNEMFSKMQMMRRELEEKMDDVINLAGVSKDEVTTFLDNPDNFPPNEWEKIQEKKKELIKMATNVVGKIDEKRKVQKKEEVETKKLRQKSLGGRKKWIPMR